MKKHLSIVVLFVLILALAVGCANNGKDPTPEPTATDAQSYEDDDYILEIVGIGEEPIKVTKGQIRELANGGKLVEYGEDQPAYASDKTDDDGNKIPHTLKGVYFDDILEAYADGAKTSDFTSMSIYAEDGYETILSADVFNVEQGGVKMIIAFEYDGVVLNPSEKSGALRAIFPDKPANTWAKQVSKIVLASDKEEETVPETESVYFAEATGDKYDGSYEVDGTTYYGTSFKKIFADGILKSSDEAQMFVYSWDGTEYTSLKTKEYYEDAFLVYASKASGSEDFVPEKDAPVFNGANILKGMKVKHTMYVTVEKTSFAVLDKVFEKLDFKGKGSILVTELLDEINMKEASTYTITGTDGTEKQAKKEELASIRIESTDEGYIVAVDGSEFVIMSIKAK